MNSPSASDGVSHDSISSDGIGVHPNTMYLTWWEKLQYKFRLHLGVNRKRLKSNVETVVIGSGLYKGEWTNEFIRAAAQRLFYFSYRHGFSRLPSGHTTDTGWGCLLRTGQMVLGQALMRYCRRDAPLPSHTHEEELGPLATSTNRLSCADTSKDDATKGGACHGIGESGNDGSNITSTSQPEHRVHRNDADEQYRTLYQSVQRLFMDVAEAPFGVHAIEHEAYAMGIPYATYLAPTQAGHAFANACTHYRERLGTSKTNSNNSTTRERMSSDGKNASNGTNVRGAPVTICCDTRSISATTSNEILAACDSILYLIPVFLGAGKLHGVYIDILKMILRMPSCCGCAGGQRSASLYFMGYQEDYVIYFDPHHVQKAFVSLDTQFSDTQVMRGKTKIVNLEPCMLIGFYIQDEAAFHRFISDLAEVNSRLVFPLISVVDTPEKALGQNGAFCETRSNVGNDDIYSISTASTSSSNPALLAEATTPREEARVKPNAAHVSQT